MFGTEINPSVDLNTPMGEVDLDQTRQWEPTPPKRRSRKKAFNRETPGDKRNTPNASASGPRVKSLSVNGHLFDRGDMMPVGLWVSLGDIIEEGGGGGVGYHS